MLAASPSPPTGLVPRFSLFIGWVKRAMGEGLLMRQVTPGGEAAAVGPLVILLGHYLSATLRRLTALHTRFAAGTLAAAPRERPAVKSTAERASADRGTERRAPAIPPGPVLLREFRVRLDSHLRALLEEPEMRALLAAAPQAGRLLRPLWRKLSREPLPEMLRLPPRPREPGAPKPPRPAKPAAASGPPGLRRVTLSDGTTAWEPKPCYPFGKPPPRQVRARPVEPPEPAPAPPSLVRPPPARDAPRPPDPNRRLSDYNWIGRLFVR
jgi:hypothetical protein